MALARRSDVVPADALVYGRKLRSVAHALANVTRDGAHCVSGASEEYPPPAIAFIGENEEVFRLPLGADDAAKIKQCARTTGDSAWEVTGDKLALGNPRWDAFVGRRLAGMYESMGIAPTAAVEMSLRKMALVEAGGRLPVNDERRTDGVFGTFVVALPGAFEGGDITIRSQVEGDAQGHDDGNKETRWASGARESPYDLSYAAFYIHCDADVEPVTSGAALYLVYDLVTTTTSNVPLFAGSNVVQQSLNMALDDYFDVAPVPLMKRSKINTDAWPTINSFACDRQFAYVLYDDSLEDVHGNDLLVAKSLEAFCTQSRGQYVLYLADAFCSKRYNGVGVRYDGNGSDINVTLLAPWIKYGEPFELACPPLNLRRRHEVAPLGHVLDTPFWRSVVARDPTVGDIVMELHGDASDVKYFTARALVVLPVGVELRQIAKLPTEDALTRLRDLLGESRDDALVYARRNIFYRPEWHIREEDLTVLEDFVKVVVEINDPELLNDLLRTVHLHCVDTHESLSSAVEHFGWPACVDTIVKRILTTPTLRGRVNLINSVFFSNLELVELDPIFDALLSLHPWTGTLIDPHRRFDPDEYEPDIDCFCHLLLLAVPNRLQDMVTVTHVEEMTTLVVPSLIRLMRKYDNSDLEAALARAWELFKPMVAKLRTDLYGSIRVPPHCRACRDLQTFLSSPAADIAAQFDDHSQRHHIREVLESVTSLPAVVMMFPASFTTGLDIMRLVKRPDLPPQGLYYRAHDQERQIQEFLSSERETSHHKT